MIGGYLSFAGIDEARCHATPAETAVRVTISAHDDRAKRPEAVWPSVSAGRAPGAGWRAGRLADPAGLQPANGQARGRGAG